jgi:hypothetical protein
MAFIGINAFVLVTPILHGKDQQLMTAIFHSANFDLSDFGMASEMEISVPTAFNVMPEEMTFISMPIDFSLIVKPN